MNYTEQKVALFVWKLLSNDNQNKQHRIYQIPQLKIYQLTLVANDKFAPASISTANTFIFPWRDATCKGTILC